MKPKTVAALGVAVLVIAGGLALSGVFSDPAPVVPQKPEVRPEPRIEPSPPPIEAAPVLSEPTPEPDGTPLVLPDGTHAAPLNGVVKPAAMTWGQRDYSPIVRTERRDQVDWYVHENGSRTTTVDLWRKDLGRYDAVTVVVHKGDPSPIDQLEQIGPIRGRTK